MGELSPRASDDDRERVVLDLREHLVHGRLTLDEFSERVELAYRACSVDELEAAGSALPAARTRPARGRPVRATVGFFAHVVRRGRLRLGRRGAVLAAFSDVWARSSRSTRRLRGDHRRVGGASARAARLAEGPATLRG